MSDSVIEIGKDGAFDISDPQPEDLRPAKPPSSKANKAKAAAQEESSMEDFAIKKKRGNEAYAANDFDLADKCYTSALEALSVRCNLHV
jgi:hydrogenase maturation factor HypF (carbamoyltransferase family)